MSENEDTSWDAVIRPSGENSPVSGTSTPNPTKERRRRRGRPRKTEQAVEPSTPQEPETYYTAGPPPIEEIFKRLEISENNNNNNKKKSNNISFLNGFNNEPAGPTAQQLAEEEREKNTLIKMYKTYFQPPLSESHALKERNWHPSDSPEDIMNEIRKMEAVVSGGTPTKFITGAYVGVMTGLEAAGPFFGLRLNSLAQSAEQVAQTPVFQKNLRELLIKYPYLRRLSSMDGMPEINILVTTLIMIKEVNQANSFVSTAGQTAGPGLRQKFSNLENI